MVSVACYECGAVFQAHPSQRRKYCSRQCYGNLRKTGDRGAAFWALVEKTDGCWLWLGRLSPKGYGLFAFDAKGDVIASRESWSLAHGPLNAGEYVLHHCDNPRCVRLDHLFLGDKGDNARDMVAKRRHMNNRKTHCKRGHLFTPENTITKPSGYRNCRTCINTYDRERHHRRLHGTSPAPTGSVPPSR